MCTNADWIKLYPTISISTALSRTSTREVMSINLQWRNNINMKLFVVIIHPCQLRSVNLQQRKKTNAKLFVGIIHLFQLWHYTPPYMRHFTQHFTCTMIKLSFVMSIFSVSLNFHYTYPSPNHVLLPPFHTFTVLHLYACQWLVWKKYISNKHNIFFASSELPQFQWKCFHPNFCTLK